MYVTQDYLADTIGARELLIAAPNPNDDTKVDAGRVADAIADVDARIDAALRAHYAVPLPDPPGFLRRAAARLVHYELCDENAMTDLIRDRARAAEKLLADLAGGRLRIGGDIDGSAATPPNVRTAQGRAQVVPVPAGAADVRGIV